MGTDEEKAKAKQRTTPVTYYRPNPWGLYDMHGNVREWCASEYDAAYGGLEQRDASGDRSNEAERVVRGGSWNNLAQNLRAAWRSDPSPGRSGGNTGFRLARM